jgi:hypothetical protein
MSSSKKRSHPEDDYGVGGLENDIKKRDEPSEELEQRRIKRKVE